MGNGQTTYKPHTHDCGTFTGDIDSRPASAPRASTAARTSGSVSRVPARISVSTRASAIAPDDALTDRSRRVWSAGEYDRISEGFRGEAQVFVKRLGVVPGQDVLDAACGTGNLTIPAARAGAHVTGFDLVGALLERAGAWAAREGLGIRLDQGTVEELPYRDARFDIVMSMFGVMFAARPERVVSELARVTRPGGRVALANWTPDGFVGRMLALHVAYAPPPAGASSPLRWGDPSFIREQFTPDAWAIATTKRTLTFRYPHSPSGTAELFRAAYGPTVRAFESLNVDRRALLANDLTDHWVRNQRPAAKDTEVCAEYLEVIAVRR